MDINKIQEKILSYEKKKWRSKKCLNFEKIDY